MILCGVILTFFVSAVTALQFLDAEAMRSTIEKSLTRTAELPIRIKSLKFDWTQGLGLSAKGFTIHSADGKRTIFSAESLFLKAKIAPLFLGEFRVKNASVYKPVARIYLDMPVYAAKPAETFPEMERPLDPDLTGEGVEAKEGKKDKSFLASLLGDPEAEAHDGQIAEGEESLLESFRSIVRKYHLTIQNIRVKSGVVHIIKRHQKKTRADEPIYVDFKIRLLRPKSGQVDALLNNVNIRLGEIKVLGTIQARDVLSTRGTLDINLKSKSFEAAEFKHVLYFMPVDLSRQAADYPLTGQFDALTINATLPIDVIDNFNRFHRSMKGKIHLNATNIGMRIGNVHFPITRWNSNGEWSGGKIHHRVDMDTLGGSVKLKGVIRFKRDKQGNDLPIIDSQLDLTDLDLKNMKVPESWRSSSGKVKGSIKLSGPLLPREQMKIDGTIEAHDLLVVPDGQPYSIQQVVAHLSNEAGTSPKADVEASNLILEGIPFNKYSGRLAFPKKKILFLKSILWPKHGKLGWKGIYQPDQDRYNLKVAGRNLKIEDFAKEYLAGELTLKGHAHGYIRKNQPLLRGASGKLTARLVKGSFKQWTSAKTLLTVLNPTSLVDAGTTGMAFDNLWGHFQVDEGLLETRDLSFESRKLKIYLEGHWDVPSGDVHMKGKALPSPDLDKALKKIPIVGRMLAGGKRHEGLIETYFKVRGTIHEPEVTLLPGESLLEKPGRLIRELGNIGQPTE